MLLKFNDIENPNELFMYIKSMNQNNDILISSEVINDNFAMTEIEEIIMGDYDVINRQTFLAKKWLEAHNYHVNMFWVKNNNHTFLIYQDDDKYNLFEMNSSYDNIRTFNSFDDAFVYYRCLEVIDNPNLTWIDEVLIYEYDVKNKSRDKSVKVLYK